MQLIHVTIKRNSHFDLTSNNPCPMIILLQKTNQLLYKCWEVNMLNQLQGLRALLSGRVAGTSH